MNCLNCYTINEDNATKCRNCGTALQQANNPTKTNYNKDETIRFLLIFLIVEAVLSLLWLLVNKIAVPLLTKSDSSKIADLYKYFGFFTDIVSITTLVIIIAALKNKHAKTVLIIILAIRILVMLSYRIFPNLI